MKAILTVIGLDKVGIIAGVSAELARLNINILDLSQTIMNGHFTMMVRCDLDKCSEDFGAVKESLRVVGEKMDMKISIQRTDIFEAMHTL